ncbi:phytanoyl-CoA dioxygenase family protein [Plantactinospora soyae]|uniref:Phytanoyl-CoA dioxygenase n=1 Tax=Plantactinospora soyae TaxID=1544732 RepID=A0A927R813_9ACTN|nr:phytanoyl-CoA dioxygenase [Plantactinospora soyae]MBE1488386.1 hypothetical protein [Plantactinospora soyae]
MDVDAFVRDGFVAVRGAFEPETAAGCRRLIWEALAEHGISEPDRSTWARPCVHVDCPEGAPFTAAGASPALVEAYDTLIGPGRWTRRTGVGGSVPVRFPSEEYPGDVGHHIEGNWWGGDEYWTNVRSRGRGLLALFLFSDVGPDDAPTRLVVGSHPYAARVLAPAGEAGMGGGAVAERLQASVFCRRTAEATGRAGDVYLCHPFIVHTATWPHRGTTPRMLAQPGVDVPDGFVLDGTDPSPVARAIVAGLG